MSPFSRNRSRKIIGTEVKHNVRVLAPLLPNWWPCPYLLTSLFTCKTKVKAQGFLTFGKKGMSVSYKTMPGT